jgi:DNA repair exonuclease SbcCD nuclease subunit
MRILHAADIHLDSQLVGLAAKAGDRADELIGATRRAFIGLVDFAIETEVSLLLIAGDLYDGDWRDFSTGLFFMAQMARLERENILVAVVKGNHDAESQITRSLRPPANVKVFRADRPETWVLEDLAWQSTAAAFPNAT